MLRYALCVLLAGISVSVGRCQETTLSELPAGLGEPGPAGGSISLLLRMRDVHQELEIDDAQRRDMAAHYRTTRSQRRSLVQGMLKGEVFDERVPDEEIRRILDLLNQNSERNLLHSLSSDQQLRLQELVWQLRGAHAWRDPATASLLALDKSQRSRLQQQLRGTTDPEKRYRDYGDAQRRLDAVLTAQQRSAWKELQGSPFGFHSLRRYAAASRENRQTQQLVEKRRSRGSTRLAQHGF